VAAATWGGGLAVLPPLLDRARGLADCLGERDKIIRGGRRRLELAIVADELPATGCGEAAGVSFAEVIGVGLGICSQRSHNGRRVRIDIGQRRNRLARAAVAGAASW